MSAIKFSNAIKAVSICVFGWACAASSAQPLAEKLPSSVWLVNDHGQLMNIDPAQPDHIKHSFTLNGLVAEDTIIGIDFRVARGDLYGLADSGRIYKIDHSNGAALLVSGSEPLSQMALGPYGFDFNPAADKLRVVGKQNDNLRLHPDSGALVDFEKAKAGVQVDPKLAYDQDDVHAELQPDIVAAAYTYNAKDASLTTNYAIDRRRGFLVMQGTPEGAVPAVSPNLGVLYSVGDLGVGTLKDASFDISDIDNVALAGLLTNDSSITALYQIDLKTGVAHKLGTLADGEHITGLAIEP